MNNIQQQFMYNLCFNSFNDNIKINISSSGFDFFINTVRGAEQTRLNNIFINVKEFLEDQFKQLCNDFFQSERLYSSRIKPYNLPLSFYRYIVNKVDIKAKELLHLDLAIYFVNVDTANVFILNIKNTGHLFDEGNGSYKIFVQNNDIIVEHSQHYTQEVLNVDKYWDKF